MPVPGYQKLEAQGSKAPIRATNLALVSEADAPDEVKQLYARFRATFGRPEVPGILQCFATHPPLLEHMMGLAETMLFSPGALGRANKEMLATFVSSQNHCDYCADSHGLFLRMNGGSSELLAAATTCDLQSTSLTSAQRSLLQFVQKITDDSSAISVFARSDPERSLSHRDITLTTFSTGMIYADRRSIEVAPWESVSSNRWSKH